MPLCDIETMRLEKVGSGWRKQISIVFNTSSRDVDTSIYATYLRFKIHAIPQSSYVLSPLLVFPTWSSRHKRPGGI